MNCMDSIEIILKKDSQGHNIELDNLSLEASKSLREVLDALISIVEHESALDLSIALKKGSAAECLIGSPQSLSVVYNKIKDAANSSPNRDNLYVNKLNVIYSNIDRSQDYEILYSNQGKKESLKPLFSKKFKSKRASSQVQNDFNLEFFHAKLELNGGKKPNFHVFTNNTTYTIQCTEKQSKSIGAFMYDKIKFSAWAKAKSNKMEYELCDVYVGNAELYYDEFGKFYRQLKSKKGTESFHFISEKLEDFYNNKDYTGARKFIRLFLNEFSTPTYLRTILVISKAFKDHVDLSDMLVNVEKLLSKKVGKVY